MGCRNTPTLGAHVFNSDVTGERIVPMCYSCNQKNGEFSLKGGITLVPANQDETCG